MHCERTVTTRERKKEGVLRSFLQALHASNAGGSMPAGVN